MSNQDLLQRDLSVLWHPCTQMKDHETLPLIPIKRGKGVYLEDFNGKQYIDAISSWWVNLFGHSHPYINQAITAQLDQLEHVMLAGFSHEPVVTLSERLVALAPDGLDRCFFADNGSCAVEVALKMSFHYWRNCGRNEKTRFVTLDNSYHGETLGALAVGNLSLYRETYGPLLLDTLVAPSPDCFYRPPGVSWEEYSRERFMEMDHLLARHADEVCAVIVEPLVQCAGYMRMYHPVYLSLLREACDRYGVHLIADEIAVGFGRTGTLFACEQAPVSPDFMCLSKGLTGGYMPLSVTLTTEQIYRAFYNDYESMTAFLHSHSYTGNPLGCSAANATLDLFQQQPVLENNVTLAATMMTAAQELNEHPHVAEVRQQGMILAVEMIKDKQRREPYPWQERRGLRVYRYALEQGVLLRPLGNVIYLMPPYVITPEEIGRVIDVAKKGIAIATRD
ncbi:MAG: adenosylmethionine--8-amino-7-oxononanoate transaminase [Gammaproteobacteria bacterium RBG_16_51_14]|nr:MAG: adenosylmethionine--8-amino-7-oxononanoate transaminase [Gammaproteobacteria bacterium RBG_16_51_14]